MKKYSSQPLFFSLLGPLLFCLILCLSSTTLAQNKEIDSSNEQLHSTFTQEDGQESSQEKEALLKRRDRKTGLFLSDYSTREDTNKISFLYHINSDATAPTDIQTLEAIYAYHLKGIWLEFFILQTSGKFKDLTSYEEGTSLGTSSREDLENSKDKVSAFGFSLGHRDNWISHFLGTNNIFTTTAAGLGLYSFHEVLQDITYSGPGLKVDFGLHRRSSQTFHYGLKVSYHLASTQRSDSDEKSSFSKSQTLSWLTFGLDISFYF